MIQFSLKCPDGHRFESWFQSADAFEKLAKAGHVTCAICGSSDVKKAIMAPRVATSRTKAPKAPRADSDTTMPAGAANAGSKPGPLSQPRTAAEQALQDLRKKIEANTEDVGRDFAREARAIHGGDAPDRPIRGEARAEDAKALLEDGVPVVPLPFSPGRKAN